MAVLWILWSVVAVVAWAFFLWSRRKFYTCALKMGGPWGLPLFGIGLELYKRQGVLHVMPNYLKEYKQKTIFTWAGPFPVVYTVDPSVANIVVNSPDCINKTLNYGIVNDAIGNGLLTSKAPKWTVHRKLWNPLFSHTSVAALLPTFNDFARDFCGKLVEHIDCGEIDVKKLLYEHSIKSSFGINMRAIVKGEEHAKILAHSFDWLLRSIMRRMLTPAYMFLSSYKLSSEYSPYDTARRNVFNSIRDILKAKLNPLKNKLTDFTLAEGKTGTVFVDEAVKLLQRNEYSVEEMVDDAFMIVFGTYEAVAHAFFSVLIFLAMHPECQEKAFEELHNLFPDKEFNVSFGNLKDLAYLEMCINESLRLSTPGPILGRICAKDLLITGNLTIPAGTSIAVDVFNMHRDVDRWGPTANVFNPDRFWSDKQNPAFMPFSGGRRNCLGSQYAPMFLKVMLSHVLRKYRFSTTFRYEDLKPVHVTTMAYETHPRMEIQIR